MKKQNRNPFNNDTKKKVELKGEKYNEFHWDINERLSVVSAGSRLSDFYLNSACFSSRQTVWVFR